MCTYWTMCLVTNRIQWVISWHGIKVIKGLFYCCFSGSICENNLVVSGWGFYCTVAGQGAVIVLDEEVVACREEMHRSAGRGGLICHRAFYFLVLVSNSRAVTHCVQSVFQLNEGAHSLRWCQTQKAAMFLLINVPSSGMTWQCGTDVIWVAKVRKTSFQFFLLHSKLHTLLYDSLAILQKYRLF